ncbi:MAG: hypothetical protein QOC72_2851 [Methylobacteriaceae bacterium]|nr:hypothetical protein [Methylobacteriaceae bacterium]
MFCLGFVARLLPAFPGKRPIGALRRPPNEIGRPENTGERPTGVVVNIGGKTQLGAAAHHARQNGEAFVGDKAALALPPLRPRVWKKQEHAPKRCVRQPVQEARGVIRVKAEVCEALRFDRGERLRHPVDEGLAADEADVRALRRGLDQMLAAAEADLEPNVGDWIGKERPPIADGRSQMDREARQQLFDEPRLMWPERLAFAAAVKAAPAIGLFSRSVAQASIRRNATSADRQDRSSPKKSRRSRPVRGRNGRRRRSAHRWAD